MTDMVETVFPILASGLVGALAALATERYRNRLERRSKYRESQTGTYADLYRSLVDLKWAADHLWQLSSVVNLSNFIAQLVKTEQEIKRNSLLVEDTDLSELNMVIEQFRNFRLGKEKLMDLLGDESEVQVSSRSIRELMRRNRQTKLRYDQLLDRIEVSFRKRMKAP